VRRTGEEVIKQLSYDPEGRAILQKIREDFKKRASWTRDEVAGKLFEFLTQREKLSDAGAKKKIERIYGYKFPEPKETIKPISQSVDWWVKHFTESTKRQPYLRKYFDESGDAIIDQSTAIERIKRFLVEKEGRNTSGADTWIANKLNTLRSRI